MSIINKVTGQVVAKVDSHQLRLSRMRRRVRAWADAWSRVYDVNKHRLVMVTLTYKDIDGWRPNHIRDFMVRYRRVIGGGLLAYAWVAELQKRGSVHYHLLLVVKRGTHIPLPDLYWSHGLTRIETARHVWYIVKYTSKGGDGEYPHGLRIFAVWIAPSALPSIVYYSFRLSSLPFWLSQIVASVGGGLPRRAVGGGWDYNGMRLSSPYVVLLS